jgi:hypothetical protein
VALHCSHEQWRRGAKEEEGRGEGSGKTNRVTSPGGVIGGDGSGSSSVYLHFFFSLFMFSRFSVSSSISVDDGAVVAADGGVAVAVLLLSSVSSSSLFCSVSLLYSFSLFAYVFFLFFRSLKEFSPFPAHLSPLVFTRRKKGREGYYPCPVVAQG